MRSAISRRQLAARVYRRIVALGPQRTRERFADEQVALFETLWDEERPTSILGATRWLLAMWWGALSAAIGARRDHRQLPAGHAAVGGPQRPFRERTIALIDVRHVLRSLRHAKWFTAGAVLTFALAIGVNIAVFAFADRVLFRPLPFEDPENLVLVAGYDPQDGQRYTMIPKGMFVEARRRGDIVADLGFAGLADPYRFAGTDGPSIQLVDASWNALDVLGVRSVAGRGFRRDDAVAKRPVALLRYEIWRSRFGEDPSVIGRLLVGGARRVLTSRTGPIEIVGILPPMFVVPSVNWAAGGDGLVLNAESLDSALPKEALPGVFARLRPGATVVAAQQQLDSLIAHEFADLPPDKRDTVIVERLQEGVFWRYRTSMQLLFAGASLVWLLGSANLATLMLARSRSRDGETAIRAALGASRSRLLFAALVESLIVCAAGAALAMLVLGFTIKSLATIIPGFFQSVILTSLDARVVLFTLIGTVSGAVLAGVYPAWRATRVDASGVLKRSTASGRRRSGRTGRGFLIIESAVGTMLVVAAALTVRSLIGLVTTDLGYQPKGLYTAYRVPPPPAPGTTPTMVPRDEQQRRAQQIVTRLEELPFVAGASIVDKAIFARDVPDQLVSDDGRRIRTRRVLDDYFDVMRTPVVAGRTFTAAEVMTSAPVAVVSVRAAVLLWPDTPPISVIGRTVTFQKQPTRQIVGIVASTRERHNRAAEPEVFTPLAPEHGAQIIVRSRSGAGLTEAALLPAFDMPGAPAASLVLTHASSALEPALQDPRLYANVFGAFALVAMLLSSVGLFAVASGEVSRRFYEIGVRRTLGASMRSIQHLVIADTVRPVLIGIVVGAIGAYWAATVMQSLLHELDARDPWTYGFVAVTLVATATVAVWLPARRASRIDPAIVLRAQ